MFIAKLIGLGLFFMIFPVFLIEYFEKRRWIVGVQVVFAVIIASALYVGAAGISMIGDWQDPLGGTNTADVSTHGRRGGLVILAIRFWPFVLMGLSAFVLWNAVQGFWNRLSNERR